MEDATYEEIDQLMQENDIYHRKVWNEQKAYINRIGEGDEEFFMITQTVGDDDGTIITYDCAYIFPFAWLYEFNEKRFQETEGK